MKKSVYRLILLSVSLCLFFTACPHEPKEPESTGKYKWENVNSSDYDFYNSNIKASSENSSFWEYSLFDAAKVEPTNVNNVSAKLLGYDICGFEGELKYLSGSVDEFGFLINMNLDENTYYALSFTPNGSFIPYYYTGTKEGSKSYLQHLIKTTADGDIHSTETNFNKDEINTIKAETLDSGSIEISINGKVIYTIETPEPKYGAIGIFQMLDDLDLANYKASNPMKTMFKISRVQRYTEEPAE